MSDTPEARAAEALKLAAHLDQATAEGSPWYSTGVVASTLRALAADVAELLEVCARQQTAMRAAAAEEIARNANCPGDPVPCHRCKGTGTVPRGPQICPTCGHGTTGTCAKNHGPASKHKGCSDWAANTGEDITHG